MIKRISWQWVIVLLLIAVLGAHGQIKKYGLKSGIVTFDFTTKVSGLEIKVVQYVYFDEYGMKECKESYTNSKLTESYLSDGETLYKIVHSEKAAYPVGKAYRGTEMKFDWNEVSDRDKKAGKAKKLANRTIAGKTCEAYEYDDGRGKTVYAGWNGLTLLTESSRGGIVGIIRATKIEENAKVPPDKFKPPAGYEVKKTR